MRIVLIRVYQPQVVEDLAQPLGIMSLDAYLRTKGFDDIVLHDMRLESETPEQTFRKVVDLHPDVVGLSALSVEKEALHELAGLVSDGIPGCTVVVGGPHGSGAPAAVAADPAVDFVVIGEGELTFHELLEAMEVGDDASDVRGIAYWDNEKGEAVITPSRPYIDNLDELPLPSWDRIDMEAYQRYDTLEALSADRWAVIDTSRGCPFKCTYCHEVFGKKFRPRTADRVIREMELLYEQYRVRTFFIYDDIFNFDRRRVIDICDQICERGWKINLQFPNGVRADIMNMEVLRALQRAGTVRVNYAIESASPRIQKQIKKHLRLDRVRKLIEDTDALGMLVHGFFMLGFPGERRDEIQATVDWACTSKLHTAAFFIVSPFEGTPLGEEYLGHSRETSGNNMSYYTTPFSLSEATPEELIRFRRNAYLRFYVNPRRLMRTVQLLPDKRVFLRWAKTFVQMLIAGDVDVAQGGNKRSWTNALNVVERIVQARRPMETGKQSGNGAASKGGDVSRSAPNAVGRETRPATQADSYSNVANAS